MKQFGEDELRLYKKQGFYVSNFSILKQDSLVSFQNLCNKLVNQKLDRKARAFVDDLHIRHADFLEFAFNYDLLDVVESVIGSDFGLAWSSALIKNKNSDFGLGWHSDFLEGVFHEGLRLHPCVSVTLAATFSTRESGCFQFLPESHLAGEAGLASPSHNVLEGESHFAELSPGFFTLHNPHTLHKSDSNRSDYNRILINFWYVSTNVSSLSEDAVRFLKSKKPGRIHLRGKDSEKICALSVNDFL